MSESTLPLGVHQNLQDQARPVSTQAGVRSADNNQERDKKSQVVYM